MVESPHFAMHRLDPALSQIRYLYTAYMRTYPAYYAPHDDFPRTQHLRRVAYAVCATPRQSDVKVKYKDVKIV